MAEWLARLSTATARASAVAVLAVGYWDTAGSRGSTTTDGPTNFGFANAAAASATIPWARRDHSTPSGR